MLKKSFTSIITDKRLLAFVGAFVVCAGVGANHAFAGTKGTYTVTVNTSTNVAMGSLGSARNSADSTQYIGCQVDTTTGGGPSVTCSATNSSGTSLSCIANNTDQSGRILRAVYTLKGDSYLWFHRSSTGRCDEIHVYNYSYMDSKVN